MRLPKALRFWLWYQYQMLRVGIGFGIYARQPRALRLIFTPVRLYLLGPRRVWPEDP